MESIKKVLIHEAVVTEIINYIKESNLKSGARLPSERELTKLLNVSRNSIREALKILETNHTITIRHGKGLFVNSIESLVFSNYETEADSTNALHQLRHLAQAREMIETFCASKVAKTITPEQVELLYKYEEDENNYLIEQNKKGNSEVYISMGLELMITDFYGNPLIKEFHKRIEGLWIKYFRLITSVPQPPNVRHEDHISIINSISSNHKVEKAMKNHLDRIISAIDHLLETAEKSK